MLSENDDDGGNYPVTGNSNDGKVDNGMTGLSSDQPSMAVRKEGKSSGRSSHSWSVVDVVRDVLRLLWVAAAFKVICHQSIV